MSFTIGNQVNFMLPLLCLESVFGASMMADTTAAQYNDDRPHQPEPCGESEREVSAILKGEQGD